MKVKGGEGMALLRDMLNFTFADNKFLAIRDSLMTVSSEFAGLLLEDSNVKDTYLDVVDKFNCLVKERRGYVK